MSAPILPAGLKVIPGRKLIPLHPGTKNPILDSWPALATDDPAQIAAWAVAFPGCNWGLAMGPSGLAAIDIDGAIGEASLFNFEMGEGSLPDTLTHKTPRGGRHLIFSDTEQKLRNSSNKLGPKIDTRGGHGFIVVPPSTFEGKPYECLIDAEPAPLPDFVAEALGRARETIKAAANIDLDQPHNIARARAHLQSLIARGDVAIEGRGGDARTYEVACEVLNLGVSPSKAPEVLADWNAACLPPWDTEELRAKIENASQYAQNEPGCYAVPPLRERFAAAIENLSRDTGPTRTSGGILPSYMGGEIGTITPPRWLITPLIPTPAVGIIFGQYGSFKTTTTLDALDGVLMGSAAFGHFASEKGDALLIAGEGLSGLKIRIEARARSHGRTLETYPLLLVAKVPRVDHPDEWAALVNTINARGLKPKIIFIDHLSIMLAGQDQNDATVATQAMQLAHELSMHFGCTVVILAHAGKDGERQVRGSSAFLDNVDFAYELTRSEGSPIVKVRCAKMRDGEAPEPFFLKAETRHGAAILTYANTDDARRASGKTVGLRRADVATALATLGACPGGVNAWTGEAGGVPTRTLATEIAAARHRTEDDGLEPSPQEIESLVTILNRGAHQGGQFEAYAVRWKPRQWAVAPGPISTGADHA